ncbi:hypothetical protein BH10PAT1_BH10PAT1_1370 [soil metagenome]
MKKLLVDSDFLVALYKVDDFNHKKAKMVFKKLEKDIKLVAINLVFQESATVVSKKMGMNDAKQFLDGLTKLITEKIDLDQSLQIEGWKIFMKQNKKGTSFIDCANLTAAISYKFDGILSFDKFYPKNLTKVLSEQHT